MRNALICTVGTSLLNNIVNSDNSGIKEALEQENYKKVVLSLMEHKPSKRICGAEINSNTSIFEKRLMEHRIFLYLLLSDTDDGNKIGNILKKYYLDNRNPLGFQQVTCITIDGLTDANSHKFKSIGLKNLVKEISKIARDRFSDHVLINATGGYKAQISFAGMIGQALQIPVCYLFEKFSEIIELPPQPISFDLSFWLENVALFYRLSDYTTDIDVRSMDERFTTLIDHVEENGQTLVCLSATGQLFHETFSHHFSRQKYRFLPPDSGIDPKNKIVKYEDTNSRRHHGLEDYLNKLRRVHYVKRIYTHYFNPNLPLKNHFKPSAKGDYSQVEGIFSDGKGTTKFDLVTTAKSALERDAILADLLAMVSE